MLSDNEEDIVRGKPIPTEDEGENDTDTAGMSSSEADYHRVLGGRRSRPSGSGHRRHKSKSPGRPTSEARQSKSSSKAKPRGGMPSRSRSSAENEDSNHKGKCRSSSRRHSGLEETASGEEETTIKTKTSSSSRESRTSATKSSTSSGRKGRTTASSSTKYAESKGDRDAKNRRRRSAHHLPEDKESDNSHTRSITTSGVPRRERGENEQLSSTGSLPKSSDSSSYRRHRSKSRSRSNKLDLDHGTERSARSMRSEKRSERSGRSTMRGAHLESTLGSTTASATTASASDDPTETRDPNLSLRSSVKVASALVKFRTVLAMSKQASASAQKYRHDQDKQAEGIGMENLGNMDTTSAHKENKKRGSSHHRRDGSRHSKHGSSSHHRRRSDHGEGNSSRNKRRTKERSDESPKRATQSSTPASKTREADVVDADAFLKEALTNVGKRLSRSSMAKESVAKKEPALAASNTTTTNSRESASALRIKSSAKVSTAVLKFQQALALSKSATRAAKTQQDTQNKLLGEVHSDKRTTEDFLARASYHQKFTSNVAVSPVYAVEVDDAAKGADSPKVPSDLDGDSDIDSEIEIDDVNEDDDTVSDVATDSEDEDEDNEEAVVETTSDMELENTAAASVPEAVMTPIDSDCDMGSDVEDHSDVDIDSDDDLDSDDEQAPGEDGNVPVSNIVSDNEEKTDKMANQSSSDASAAAMDSDDDIDNGTNSDGVGELQKSEADQLEMLTPTHSSLDEKNMTAAIVNQNGSSEEPWKDGVESTTTTEGSELVEMSNKLVMARSLSFNASLNGHQSQILLDKSLTDWKSARDVTSTNEGQNLAIPGLSPGGSKASLMAEEGSLPALSYLPMTMKKQERDHSPDGYDDEFAPKPPQKSPSSRRLSSTECSDTETKPPLKEPSRKSSSRSLRKSKSNGDQLDTARKLVGDDSLGRRTRGGSRMRKTPSRSRSSCSTARLEHSDSRRERKSKSSSSSGGKSRSADRAKSSDRATKRSSSASRSRTLTGLSSFSQAATSGKAHGHPSSEKREDGRRPSSRRRTPNRAKSHDVASEYRKSSRSASSRNTEKDSRDRRSRKPSSALD